MNEIWVNRLIAGTKTWEEVPESRKITVKAILSDRVKSNIITPEQYLEITGEEHT